jgi:hypothetical protein
VKIIGGFEPRIDVTQAENDTNHLNFIEFKIRFAKFLWNYVELRYRLYKLFFTLIERIFVVCYEMLEILLQKHLLSNYALIQLS